MYRVEVHSLGCINIYGEEADQATQLSVMKRFGRNHPILYRNDDIFEKPVLLHSGKPL
jgi:hypothetical protein